MKERQISMLKVKSFENVVKPFRDAARKSGFSQKELFRLTEKTNVKEAK